MVGQTVSHYRILSTLGVGGMGAVYEAEDLRLGRRVAIKFLADEARRSPETMERFRREARIVSSLSHPHIAVLHDIGEHAGEQFMVMELLEGEPLKARIARGALAIDEVLSFGAQIADALDAAHAQGVVHRDIKPANLFITHRGLVKVLDFGVAKLAEPVRQADLADTRSGDDGLTTVGTTLGTVSYMSPEQARGQEIDSRSDLFSVGVVLYEMATGRTPFQGVTPAVIFEGILTKDPPPASTLNGNVSPELDRIIARALAKNLAVRYQTAAEIRADLKRLERDTDVSRVVAGAPALPVSRPAVPLVSAPAPARSARRLAWLFAAPIATMALAGGAVLWQSTRAPALSARDTVVLADFANRTGDVMFDDTLAEALALQLRQSPFLNPVVDQQVQSTLRLMGLEPMAKITPEIGRDLCQRVGGKALLGGSIAGLGSSYVITLNAQDCVTGETLAEEQVQAASKEAVLSQLGQAASRFRERLGESLPSIQRYDARIEEATTGSLEALKAYSQGTMTRRTLGDFESIPFFRRAVDLDPKFALAYARLGTVMGNEGDRKESIANTQKAYDLRERVSERERLYIEARYHSTVTRDLAKAIEAYRLLIVTYPADHAGHTNLAILYKDLGRTQEAITELKEATRLAPSEPLGPFNLGYAYLDLGQFADARQAFEQALALRDGTAVHVALYTIAVVTGDTAAADAQVAAVAGRRDEVTMIGTRAMAAAYRGRLNEAEQLTTEWLRHMESTARTGFAGEGVIGMAISDAIWGRTASARRLLADAERQGLLVQGATDEMIGLAAILGDASLARTWRDRALAHAKELSTPADYPEHERVLNAMVALAGRRYQEAYDLASTVPVTMKTTRAAFAAGIAAAQLKRYDEARVSFQAMLEHTAKGALDPAIPVAQIHLARVQAALGDRAAARAAYEAAFQHVKGGDTDLPLLLEAQKEYEKLGS